MLFFLFRLFRRFILCLPATWQRSLFNALANLAYHIDKKHRMVIRQNVAAAYNNQLSPEQTQRIERGCYANLMRNILQIIINSAAPIHTLNQHVKFDNLEQLDTLIATNTPIIFCAAHYDNWELGAAALSLRMPKPVGSVYKALKNRAFDTFLKQTRSRCNIELIERQGAFKTMANMLKNGQSIAMLVDQNIDERRGIAVNFFDITTLQTFAPATLAQKYHAAIVPSFIYTDESLITHISFDTPFYVNQTAQKEEAITSASQRIATALETHIKKEPSRWFWCHRRWKANHPDFYD